MIITSIRLENFGPHREFTATFDEDVTAIVGGNGSGKSFLIEAVPAVLYGEWPSRGNLANGISRGNTKDAKIELDFTINDVNYKAIRLLRKSSKTVTQDAYLYADSEVIAGPKVSDFEQVITNLIGDSKVFFASAFSAQNGTGDIVDCKPTDRKRIMSELLGLDKYQVKSDNFNQLKRDLESKINSFEITKTTLESSIKIVDELKIEMLTTNINELETKKLTIADQIELDQESLAKLKQDLQYNVTLIDKRQELNQMLLNERERAIKLKSDIETRLNLIAQLPTLLDLDTKRSIILEKNKEISTSNLTILKQQSHVNIEITSINAQLSQLNSNIEQHAQQIKSLESQCSILDSGNYTANECTECNFVASAFSAKQKLSELSKRTFESPTIYENQLTKLKDKLINLVLETEIQIPNDVTSELNTAKVGEAVLTTLQSEYDICVANGKKLRLEYENFAEIDTSTLKTQIEEVKLRIDSNQSLIYDISKNIQAFQMEITQIQTDIKNNKELITKIDTLLKSNITQMKQYQVYDYLYKAFGRNGIQALLIDSMIPTLQNISDELIEVATAGKMRLEFSTERELKDGRTSESFEILAIDEHGARDVSTYSGGEQRLLRTVIRLSLAIYQSLQSNRKLETVILDEAFDALDNANTEQLLSMFNGIGHYFKKVIFISHSNDLLTEFDNKIYLGGEHV